MLKRDFFARPTLMVAAQLLGRRLVREVDGQRLSGIIVETEAYIGPDDSASHASKGRTPRTEVMFGPPGHLYIYLIYGMYHMLNFITEEEDIPAAVLIRAVEPQHGLDAMQRYRQKNGKSAMKAVNLTNGPGKLCQAFNINNALNRWDATLGRQLWLEAGSTVAQADIMTGPRIGIDYATPKDRDARWRFWIRDNPFVSRKM